MQSPGPVSAYDKHSSVCITSIVRCPSARVHHRLPGALSSPFLTESSAHIHSYKTKIER